MIVGCFVFHIWNMTRFDDFDGLSLFVRIVDAGGLGAGERATGIPKATLSRRLTSGRSWTHSSILSRTPCRPITLTEVCCCIVRDQDHEPQ